MLELGSSRSWEAFISHEVPVQRDNYRICCLVAMVFMPAGACLEFLLQDISKLNEFFPVRIGSSLALGIIWILLGRAKSSNSVRILGLSVAIPPVTSIAWMVHETGGASSHYYAGLNLVIAGAALLMRWTMIDSLLVVCFTILAYILACISPAGSLGSNFLSNMYFIMVNGVMVVVGTWIYNRVRFNEFLLNHKLEESNHKLRELDEIKSRFFANISHELRTPLTLLIAPVEALIQRGADINETMRQEMLGTMQTNAMRLLKLINNLLDLVRMESGTISIISKPVDINSFIHGLTSACSSVAKDKHIQLNASCESNIRWIMGDSEKLERICLNLLFNALKFTPAGGSVNFNARRENEWLVLEVADTGVGISPEHLPHLFSRFWQADPSSQRKYQGMGIGLALVKELVTAKGGNVTAESTLGKGTTIQVRIPYSETSRPDKQGEEDHSENDQSSEDWIRDLYRRAEQFPAIPSLQIRHPRTEDFTQNRSSSREKPMLLIADDEPEMLAFLKSQLMDQFQVIEATDGQQAIDKATQFMPDVILSDMMMPLKDGLQVCKEIRAKSTTQNIPILLLTARADEKSKIESLNAGATDFVGKPFSLTELRARLKNVVESHFNERELTNQKLRLESALEQIKDTETMLVQSEKLSSLGRMSAGLIHEINNPLNFAVQGLHLIRRGLTKVSPEIQTDLNEIVTDIENGVNRVVTIISDLRGFTRTEDLRHTRLSVNELVQTVLRFFSHDLKGEVKVTVDIHPEAVIDGNQGQLTQVLVNLIQNAIDAMKSKTYGENEASHLTISAEQNDKELRISVKDNGDGIPKALQDKIFDPFFTTKDVGKGMGLGLSICHRIIAEHHGLISIKSQEQVGTEFILEFPQSNP